jgi:hypothetical protein
VAGLLADGLSYGAAFAVTGALCAVAAFAWLPAPETLPRKAEPAEEVPVDETAVGKP